jgi:hypothetical protein
MGLEHTVVKDPQTDTADTHNYTEIANVVATIGGNTVVVGKQELNTPMCFTEGWNIHRNTFDANVLVNKSLISGTTLVFADVKSTNASGAGLTYNGAFTTALNAEMMALHTTVANTPVNAYYYEVGGETVSWYDTKIAGISAIYAQKDPASGATGSAFAVSGSTKVAGLNLFAAYSSVSDDGQNFTNYATDKKTKLPTQAVYVDGQNVANSGADTWKIKLSGMKIAGINLAIQHISCDDSDLTTKATETDIIATTKVAGVALKALLMQNEEAGSANKHEKFRVYANYSF